MTSPASLPRDIDDWDPVVTDQRLAKAQEEVVGRLPSLLGAEFVTFIQPGKLLTDFDPPREIPEMAVFAIMSPDPKHPGNTVMTHGTAALDDYLSAEREYMHFVGIPDPLVGILLNVGRQHRETIRNLREMI